MRVEALVPDIAPVRKPVPVESSGASAFTQALSDAAQTLQNADEAEDRFAAGRGSLVNAIYARAKADVTISVATAAAQRCAQALSTVLSMQV